MTGPDFLPLRTPRLLLRRMQRSDVERFAAYRADAELARFQGWDPMTAAEAAVFIEDMQAAPALIEGKWLQIAIVALSEGGLVGDLGFCLQADGDLAVGFTLRRQSQGQGFATEALRSFAAAMLQCPTVQRVVGIVDARNAASIRVLERVGMRCVNSCETVFKGEPCAELRFELGRGGASAAR